MELSEANSPLLNDYKYDYVKQILPQTFLGGLRILSSPYYVNFLQLLLWGFPFLISIVLTLIMETIEANGTVFAVVEGTIIFICHLGLNFLSLYCERNKQYTQAVITNNFLADNDNDHPFTNCCSLTVLQFIVTRKKYLSNAIIHPLIAGVASGFCFFFLLPSNLEMYLGDKNGAIIYFIIGWFVSCVGIYPLVGQVPKEPNTLQLNDPLEISLATRAFYLLTLAVPSLFIVHQDVQLTLAIVFALLPFFWLFGVLPRTDVFLFWLSEQCLINILGGSPMASTIRLVLVFVPSCVIFVVSYFIPHGLTVTVVLSMFAVLMSTDIATFVVTLVRRFGVGSNKFRQINLHQSRRMVIWKECVFTGLYIVLAGATNGLASYYKNNLSTNFKSATIQVLGGLLIAMFVSSCLVHNLQKMFFFSVIKNPFFPWIKRSRNVKQSLAFLVFAIDKIALTFTALLLNATFAFFTKQQHEMDFIFVLLFFRSIRVVFQDIKQSSMVLVLYTFVYWSDLKWDFWEDGMNYPLQLFAINLILSWMKSFLQKSWFFVLLSIASKIGKSGKANQRKINNSLIMAVVLFPILLSVLLFSSLLSMPVLPVFTLPFLILAFPRPRKMWPDAEKSAKSTSNVDWVFYQQMTPTLQGVLSREFSTGVLSNSKAGDYLLARFQDRILWISVLEHGFLYNNVVVKGLELQETSCHSTEAQSIDDLFNDVSNNSKFFNNNFIHTLTPLSNLQIDVYSDAKNVLTGIIDNREFLADVSHILPKVLLWESMKLFKERCKFGVEHPSIVDDLNNVYNLKSEMADIISDEPFTLPFQYPPHSHHRREEEETVFTTFSPTFIKSEDDFDNDKGIKMHGTNKHDEEDEDDDEFGNFGFGDDENLDDGVGDDTDSLDERSHNKVETYDSHSNPVSKHSDPTIEPPRSWISTAPFRDVELLSITKHFDTKCYHAFIDSLFGEYEAALIKSDTGLMQSYRLFVLNCFFLVEKGGVADDSIIKEGASHCYRAFSGKLPWSPRLGWIESNEILKQLVINSYRMAFKLTYDAFILGDRLSDTNSKQQHEDFLQALAELQHHGESGWYIGLEGTDEWMNRVLEECPQILSLGRNEKDGVYTSRLLTMQKLEVSIATINAECVNGLWAALALELYYITNDDDERYSIQALPLILRNIVTQAADPPLGYPVYSSGLLKV